MTATLVSLLVLCTNLIATIYTRSKYTPTRGVVSMYEGSCSWVKNVDTGLHVCINALSTLLLGASNLCMQILAAPTRRELDKAHAKQRWLDIGVPSWRNLRNVGAARQVMWWCLGLSSVPLHFM
jgi:NADH:ubiquinone oxidoreductase subunit 4 (subunit M)